MIGSLANPMLEPRVLFAQVLTLAGNFLAHRYCRDDGHHTLDLS
jgi:hypothetical protein